MKYTQLVLLIVAVGMITGSLRACECNQSHTFLRPRSFSQNNAFELALNQYQVYATIDPSCTGTLRADVQGTLFYYQSTNGEALARYFLPHENNSMLIGQNNASDISSPWLEIMAPDGESFSSIVTIRPQRKIVGAAFKLYVDANPGMKESCNWWENIWFSAFIPVAQTRHTLHLCEDIVGTAGELPGFQSAIEAFNNPAWCYGKLPTCTTTKSGIDGANIKLGYFFRNTEEVIMSAYLVGYSPDGMQSDAKVLFEPTMGSGGHGGLGLGLNGIFKFPESCGISMLFDMRYGYLFSRHETRSIDLTNGDWSRYLLTVKYPDLGTPLPGINLFTRTVTVSPRASIDTWFAVHYATECIDVELGYDFWWRQPEVVALPEDCECDESAFENTSIFDIAGCCRVSAVNAGICQGVRGTGGAPMIDPVFTPLTNRKFCFSSAQSGRAYTNTVYLALSQNICLNDMPAFWGGAITYEAAAKHSALSQWGIWLKSHVWF